MHSNTTATLQRTLSGHVAAELHRLILDGTLAAGSMLRIQEVAERFNTSSMPVREALRILDAMGLVEVIPHRGTRVAELTRAESELDAGRENLVPAHRRVAETVWHVEADLHPGDFRVWASAGRSGARRGECGGQGDEGEFGKGAASVGRHGEEIRCIRCSDAG